MYAGILSTCPSSLKKRIFTLESCGIVPAGNSHDQFPKSSRAIGVASPFQPLKSPTKAAWLHAGIHSLYTIVPSSFFENPYSLYPSANADKEPLAFSIAPFTSRNFSHRYRKCPSCGFNISSISIRSVPSFEYAFVSSVFCSSFVSCTSRIALVSVSPSFFFLVAFDPNDDDVST